MVYQAYIIFHPHDFENRRSSLLYQALLLFVWDVLKMFLKGFCFSEPVPFQVIFVADKCVWFFLTFWKVFCFLEESWKISFLFYVFFPSSFLSLESKRENVSFYISFICMSLIKDTLFRCWDGVQMLGAMGSGFHALLLGGT